MFLLIHFFLLVCVFSSLFYFYFLVFFFTVIFIFVHCYWHLCILGFHVDRLHPVDSFSGTNHKGVGSGTWWRNGPSEIKEGDTEESIDVVQIEPEKILWSEMQWGGLARPIIELTGPAKLNFHRQCSVWKLKSSVNTLIMRERLGIKNFSPGKHSTYTMRKTNGGITMRDSRKK